MKFWYSLKFRLLFIFLLCMLVPSTIISIITATYFQNLITRETDKLTTSTITSMAQNIETYMDDLENLTMSLYMNGDIMFAVELRGKGKYNCVDAYTRLTADRALYRTLPNLIQDSRKDILGCVLLTFDETLFATYKYDCITRTVENYPYKECEWYKQAVKADGKVVFTGTHKCDYFKLSNPPEAFSVARIIKDPDTRKPLALVMADAKDVVLKRIVDNINFSVNSITMVLDHNGMVLYSNYPVSQNVIKQINENRSFVKDKNDSYVLSSKSIEKAGWKIVVLSSYSEISSRVRKIFSFSILFFFLCVVVTFILYYILSSRIMKPFEKIINTMKEVENGNLTTRLKIKGKDEVAELGHALNHMIKRLNDLVKREYKAVLNQRNAEYYALQAQIQPHFLYNTLSGFIGLNRMGKRQVLESSILSLTGMLRYILEQDNLSNVKNEFLFIEQYCKLQKCRFEDRADIFIEFDENISNYKIPKLLLQPLVENAIVHGLEPIDRRCRIEVTAKLIKSNDSNYVELKVSDDGAGFDIHKNYIKPNVGLSNVIERLKIAFKEHDFNIKSEPDKGTEVIIKIPENEVVA